MSARTGTDNRKTLIALLVIAVIILLLIILLAVILQPAAKHNTATGQQINGDCIAFLDVGQGDGALIKSGDNSAVIDTGTPEGAADFCKKLKAMGVKGLTAMLLTHNHDDHVGGSAALAERFGIKNLIMPDITATESPTRILGTVTRHVTADGGNCVIGRSGAAYDIGGIKLTVLCCYYELNDENDRSIISIAEMDGKRFLFTGDAGRQAENRMIQDGINFDCDVLKAGHHGSSSSSTSNFLAIASPEYAVISCGKNNSYRHPHYEAIERLKTAGAVILRTDQSGDITFFTNNGALTVKTEK